MCVCRQEYAHLSASEVKMQENKKGKLHGQGWMPVLSKTAHTLWSTGVLKLSTRVSPALLTKL